jgi:hypothetical protein
MYRLNSEQVHHQEIDVDRSVQVRSRVLVAGIIVREKGKLFNVQD